VVGNLSGAEHPQGTEQPGDGIGAGDKAARRRLLIYWRSAGFEKAQNTHSPRVPLGTNPRILQNIEPILRRRRDLTLSPADGARQESDRIWLITFQRRL
jgi:hypothetical protein